MKITGMRSILVSAPLPEPVKWFGGTYYGFDSGFVELQTDDGRTGIGEATQATAAVLALPSIVEAMAHLVVGRDLTSAVALRHHVASATRFWARGGIAVGAISAIEIAAYDLLAQEAGVPLWKFLGGLAHPEMQAYASTGIAPTIDGIIAQIRNAQSRGFRIVKLRAYKSARDTLELLDAVSDEISQGQSFALDAAQGQLADPWSFRDAVEVGRRLGELNAQWFEEPLTAHDVDGYRELRRKVDVPLAGVETYNSRDDFARLINARGVDVVQPDSTIVGGISEFLAVTTLATTASIRTVPHTWGSGVAILANYHAAFSQPAIQLVEFSDYANPLMSELLDGVLEMRGDMIQPPHAPGLGVSLTSEFAARHGNVKAGTGISAGV